MRVLGIISMKCFNDWCIDYTELTIVCVLYQPCMVCVQIETRWGAGGYYNWKIGVQFGAGKSGQNPNAYALLGGA